MALLPHKLKTITIDVEMFLALVYNQAAVSHLSEEKKHLIFKAFKLAQEVENMNFLSLSVDTMGLDKLGELVMNTKAELAKAVENLKDSQRVYIRVIELPKSAWNRAVVIKALCPVFGEATLLALLKGEPQWLYAHQLMKYAETFSDCERRGMVFDASEAKEIDKS